MVTNVDPPKFGKGGPKNPKKATWPGQSRHSGFWVCSKCGRMRKHAGNGFADAHEVCRG